MATVFEPVDKVTLNDGTIVEVKELTIIPMMGLIRRIGVKVSEVFKTAKAGDDLDLPKVIEIVSGCEDIIEYLLKHSTGRTDYTTTDGLNVLEAAIALNLTEDSKKKLLKIGSEVAARLGIRETSQAKSPTP